jgi:TPR repeat protein
MTNIFVEYSKAQYAIGYFTEMGIGCRRDPLEANVWYVRAAERGDERAVARLAIIRSAETGDGLHAGCGEKGLKKKKSWWKLK